MQTKADHHVEPHSGSPASRPFDPPRTGRTGGGWPVQTAVWVLVLRATLHTVASHLQQLLKALLLDV